MSELLLTSPGEGFLNLLRIRQSQSDVPPLAGPNPAEFARIKALLLQSTDIETGEVQDLLAFGRFLDAVTQYLDQHWDQLPEETRKYIIQQTQTLLKILPDEHGRLNWLALFAGLWELRGTVVRSIRRYVSLHSKMQSKQHRAITQQNIEKLQAFTSLIQKLKDREQKRGELQQKLAQYPDWNREEQIQRNQGAIRGMQDWLNKDITQEEQVARDKHYEIFEKIIGGDCKNSE